MTATTTLPLAEADKVLAGRHATLATRQVTAHAIRAGLKPQPEGVTRGSYRIVVDAGGRDGLFGCIYVGARTGRILRAFLMHGNNGVERRHDDVAEIRTVITSWYALTKGRYS